MLLYGFYDFFVKLSLNLSQCVRFPTMWFCALQSLRSACAYAQSDQSLCKSFEYSMTVKLLTEHHLEFLSLKGGCRGSSEFTHVKMSYCLKSHALALMTLMTQFVRLDIKPTCIFSYNTGQLLFWLQ